MLMNKAHIEPDIENSNETFFKESYRLNDTHLT